MKCLREKQFLKRKVLATLRLTLAGWGKSSTLPRAAEPGGKSISEDVRRRNVPANAVDTGEQSLKKVLQTLRVHRAELCYSSASRTGETLAHCASRCENAFRHNPTQKAVQMIVYREKSISWVGITYRETCPS